MDPSARTSSAGRHAQRSALVASWRRYPISISLLRLFLGVTFLYAGIQKLADPGFFDAGSPSYIGSQLHAFANGSPIAPLFAVLEHIPVLTGIGIALAEIAIGIGTLVGVALIVCASAGFAVNTMLFLSATWHVHPYFLGSDSIYAVAWLVLLVGVVEVERRPRPNDATAPLRTRIGLDRRELIRGGAVALVSLFAGAAARAFAGSSAPATARVLSGQRSTPARRTSAPNRTPSAPATPSIQGKPIASLDRLNVGDAMAFNDPGSGPAVLFRTGRDSVSAYSRICTHAGCEVGYNPSARILVCPCHGAEFDPAHGARPIAGPTSTPLPAIQVEIDPATGDVILPS